MKYHPMDQAVRPNASTTLKHTADWQESPSPRVRRRHSLRNTSRKKSRYDARLDSNSSESASSVESSAESSDEASDATSDDEGNLLTKAFLPRWCLLEPLDRELYHMQWGLPICKILPNTWKQVMEQLIRNGRFTRQEYRAWGGETALRARYDSLRKHLQGDFADEEPRRREEWTFRKPESWKVPDKRRGEETEAAEELPRVKKITPRGSDDFFIEFTKPASSTASADIIVVNDGSTSPGCSARRASFGNSDAHETSIEDRTGNAADQSAEDEGIVDAHTQDSAKAQASLRKRVKTPREAMSSQEWAAAVNGTPKPRVEVIQAGNIRIHQDEGEPTSAQPTRPRSLTSSDNKENEAEEQEDQSDAFDAYA